MAYSICKNYREEVLHDPFSQIESNYIKYNIKSSMFLTLYIFCNKYFIKILFYHEIFIMKIYLSL